MTSDSTHWPDPAMWARARQRAHDLDFQMVKRRARITQVVAALWPRAMYWRLGPELVTCCPWHADTHPSFCVNPAKQKVFCHPCGFAGDVFDVVMRERGGTLTDAVATVHDLTAGGPHRLRVWDTPAPPRRAPQDHTTSPSPTNDQTEIYSYCDRGGDEQYQVLRLPGKRFRCRHWDAQAQRWIWNLTGVDPLIYHGDLLSRLAYEDGLVTCLVVEGEKACDVAWALGFPATTNSGGAGKWTPAHARQLLDLGIRRITILPDHDPVGAQHAEAVAASLTAATTRRLRLPGLPPKGDVADWVAAGGTSRELLRLMRRCWA